MPIPSAHDNTREIRARVKELSLQKELSQLKLANIAEIHRTYMTGLGKGRSDVSLRGLKANII